MPDSAGGAYEPPASNRRPPSDRPLKLWSDRGRVGRRPLILSYLFTVRLKYRHEDVPTIFDRNRPVQRSVRTAGKTTREKVKRQKE